MQLAIMEFFQTLSSPLLDTLVSFLTMLGEQTVFILFITYLLWNSSKKRGFVIFSTLAFSLVTMGFLKAIVKAPRPFQVIESIEGKRVQTATGYSFPSGHTTGAASFYSSVAATYKKRALSILCALLILLVGLSRMYLGVHWPLDVFGGLALGITGTALLLPLFSRLYGNEDLLVSFTMITGFISIFIALVLVVTMEIGVSDIVAYEDVMKLLSLLGCGYVGFSFAQSTLFYEVKAKTLFEVDSLHHWNISYSRNSRDETHPSRYASYNFLPLLYYWVVDYLSFSLCRDETFTICQRIIKGPLIGPFITLLLFFFLSRCFTFRFFAWRIACKQFKHLLFGELL